MGLGDKVLFLFIFVEIIGIVDGDGLDDEINFSLVLSLERRYVYIYIMFICRVCWYRNISISMIEYLFFVWVSVIIVYVGSLFYFILFI